MASQDDLVLRELNRAAVLAGRPGVAVIERDADRADRITGDRGKTLDAIDRLVANERARRIRRGLLLLADETGRWLAKVEDVVAAIAAPAYLISAGRALQHHDLTDQHFFTVLALTDRRHAPVEVGGERATFRRVASGQLDDVATWAPEDARARWRIATAERAVLDGIAHPRYGVSLDQATGAMITAVARDSGFLPRLIDTVARSGSAADARRTGLLITRLIDPTLAAPLLQLRGKSRTPVLLRAGGPHDGPVDPIWRVIVNRDLDLLERAA